MSNNNKNNIDSEDNKEKYASSLGLKILIYSRLYLGKTVCDVLVSIVIFFIWLISKKERNISKNYLSVVNEYQKKKGIPLTKFSSLKHMLFYSRILTDRVDTFLSKSIPIDIDPSSMDDWATFQDYINQKQGCFLLFSHVGNIYVLPGIRNTYPKTLNTKVNIYMDIGRTPVFHNFMLDKNNTQNIFFHSTKNMNIKTGYDILSFLEQSHLILMGVDRIKDKNPKHIKKVTILDTPCYLSSAIFKIAQSSEAPIFFISCIKNKSSYTIYIKHYLESFSIEESFASFMQQLILKSPINWCNWFNFFSTH